MYLLRADDMRASALSEKKMVARLLGGLISNLFPMTLFWTSHQKKSCGGPNMC